MKKLRILSIIVFVTALAAFGISKKNLSRTKDTTAPEIIMDEDTITVTCDAAEAEFLAGVRAEDEQDGDVTDSLVIESMSNFIEKGRRKITIAAFDSDNNITKVSREIVYSDYQSPRFEVESPLRFPLNTQEIFTGISVHDTLDGDLTNKIKISDEYYIAVDKTGDYPMVFSVSNSVGEVVKLPVTVEIYDPMEENRNPQIELSEYIVYTPTGKSVNPWAYVERILANGREYKKGEDGALHAPNPGLGQPDEVITSDDVEIIQKIDYNVPGVYEVTYRFTEEKDSDKTGKVRLLVVVGE